MRQISYLTVIGAIVLFAFSCSQETIPAPTGELVDDVLLKFDLLPQITETSAIDFSRENSAKHLVSGWYKNREAFTWATGPISVFAFESFHNKNNKIIEITCAPLYTSKLQNQEMILKLNDKSIGTISLNHEMDTYNLELPAANLRPGKNLVQLEFSYSLNLPNAVMSKLSAMFEKIVIKSKPNIPEDLFKFMEDGSLRQYSSSSFAYTQTFPEPTKLVLDYNIKGGATAAVVLKMADSPPIEHILPRKKNQIDFDIPKSTNSLIRMDFVVNDNGRSGYVDWKRVAIYSKPDGQLNLNEEKPTGTDQNDHQTKGETYPDIIIYVIDALRSDHVGCYGYERNTTPNIDAFATSNTLFKQAYANASWTRPSGATILTGLLPKNHKTATRDSKLPEELITMAELLQVLGYYTVAVNTNGNVGEEYGFSSGFNEFIALKENVDQESIHQRSDVLNQKTFEFLERFLQHRPRRPLFLWIWSSDPHDPYSPHKSVKEAFNIQQYPSVDKKYRLVDNLAKRIKATKFRWPSSAEKEYLKTLYDQEILFNDKAFGNLIKKLKQKQIYENAIIILTSDHGEEFFDHNWIGHGKTLFQEQIKIPLIIKAPEIQKGEKDIRIQHADIFPTLLDILQEEMPHEMDGMSILDMTACQDRPIFAEETVDGHDLRSILMGDYKLIHNLPDAGYLYVSWRELYPYEYFNLKTDPEEHSNIADFTDINFSYLIQKLAYEFSDFRKGLDIKSEKATISRELEERLKALGYIK